MKRLKLATALSALSLLAMTTGALALDVILSNDNNALGVKGQTFELLKSEIEARLGDDVDVEVHHGGSLFDQNTQIAGVQLGSASIIAPTSGIYAPTAPGVTALTLPFLLTSPEKIRAAMDDPVVREAFVPELEAKTSCRWRSG